MAIWELLCPYTFLAFSRQPYTFLALSRPTYTFFGIFKTAGFFSFVPFPNTKNSKKFKIKRHDFLTPSPYINSTPYTNFTPIEFHQSTQFWQLWEIPQYTFWHFFRPNINVFGIFETPYNFFYIHLRIKSDNYQMFITHQSFASIISLFVNPIGAGLNFLK